MLDVHAPHDSVHSWKSAFIHIAIITIGLLIAVGLEKSVEFFHHRHQAHEGMAMLLRELDENRKVLAVNFHVNEQAERQHRADLGVLQRLRQGTSKVDDRLIFIRPYQRLVEAEWKIVHESGAGAYIPYDLMAEYGTLYELQDVLNKEVSDASYELQRASAALNTEQENLSREEENRLQMTVADETFAQASDESYDAMMSKLSADQDLKRLTPAQIDRLEQGFQLAITADRRLNRYYLALGHSYDKIIADPHSQP